MVLCGAPVNADAVDQILAATKVTTQLGGGIRDLPTMTALGSGGYSCTAAVRHPELVIEACRIFPIALLLA